MPRVSASRELPASRADVWRLVSESRRFADWWPGIAEVRPGRTGFAEGARWELEAAIRPGVLMLSRTTSSGMLLVRGVDPPRRFSWYLTGDHVDVELRLEEETPERTRAELEIEGTWMFGLARTLPRKALFRLHALCETASGL